MSLHAQQTVYKEAMSVAGCWVAPDHDAVQGIPNAVLISVMTPHQFVGGFEGNVSGCMWHGQPLGCQFVVPRRNPHLHMQSGGASKSFTIILTLWDVSWPPPSSSL